MSEQEKHYIVHFTGARDDAPGIFPMVAYRNDEGKPIVIEPSEHEETFTYDEGFTYDVAKVYKRQTHGELEELISDSDGLSISIWDLRDLLKGE